MRRNKLEIISVILKVCMSGAGKTKIVYSANLNFKTVNAYLDMLSDTGLIESGGKSGRYMTTQKGRETLRNLEAIQKDLIQPLLAVEALVSPSGDLQASEELRQESASRHQMQIGQSPGVPTGN